VTSSFPWNRQHWWGPDEWQHQNPVGTPSLSTDLFREKWTKENSHEVEKWRGDPKISKLLIYDKNKRYLTCKGKVAHTHTHTHTQLHN
jgi:hypothetical protein